METKQGKEWTLTTFKKQFDTENELVDFLKSNKFFNGNFEIKYGDTNTYILFYEGWELTRDD